ncbi:RskA family anti-sigma factor [Nocardia callitridis]|uniref:Anti-sigma-K factor RskA N-terminal domain-containing protein n=1 Tax=Nocardia callitridis TaxID=648753 RepID=A0ABP9KGM5_9NOCA
MTDIVMRSASGLLDLAYPLALDAIVGIERAHLDVQLRNADPTVRQAFSDSVWQLREVLARLSVLHELSPPPDLAARVLAALPCDNTW